MGRSICIALICLVTFSTSFGCDININFRQLHGLQMAQNTLNSLTSKALIRKGFTTVVSPALYTATITLSKGKDTDVFKKYFAKASVSLLKNGHMESYTYAIGRSYSDIAAAYSGKMYALAIEKAISHIAVCQNE